MSLKPRLFTRDARRASQDLAANLRYAISKVCRDKPVKLSLLKVDYDRFFKDKISTKTPEAVAAALRSIEEYVIAVKVYVHVNNREMTDSLVGLRSATYAAEMHNEDSPQVSREGLLHIIREQALNGIYVCDLEERYIAAYGNRPSYLPYKSIKELLHRTPDVELASSGKTLRVRIRQQTRLSLGGPTPTVPKRSMLSRIPSLNRSSVSESTTTSSHKARKARDVMSISMFRPRERSFRDEVPCEMTRSAFIPSSSSSSSSGASSAPSSGSGSPNGSIDMSMSMLVSTASNDIGRTETSYGQGKWDMRKHNKEIMAAILNGLPPEGLTLKGLIDEFVTISGQPLPLGVTAVDFLKREFSDVVKIDNDPDGLRVYNVNSPSFPRRSLADVYTQIALHSNRRPSDRVLKVLKDIYKKRESDTCTAATQSADFPRVASIVPVTPSRHLPHVPEDKNTEPLSRTPNTGRRLSDDDCIDPSDEFAPCTRPRLSSMTRSQRPVDEVTAELKERVAQSPVEYPGEFEKIVEGTAADNQPLLIELMSSLNLCLKPSGGRMVLTAN